MDNLTYIYINTFNKIQIYAVGITQFDKLKCEQHPTLHPTAGLLLKAKQRWPWMEDQMLLEVVLEGQ